MCKMTWGPEIQHEMKRELCITVKKKKKKWKDNEIWW